MPEGFRDRNPNAHQPSPPQPSFLENAGRGLTIGAQAVGRGVADVPGAFVDIPTLALNAGANLLGLPGIENPVGGSQSISDAFSSGVEAIAPDLLYDQAEMTPEERTLYEAERFSSGGGLASGLIRKFQGAMPRSLSAPYAAEGSDARVFAGDAAAGSALAR